MDRPQLSRRLRAGCYLVQYTPRAQPLVAYDGTLRVESTADHSYVSGDLYQRALELPTSPGAPTLARGPRPADGIPILPRAQYRYYLRVTRLVVQEAAAVCSVTLDFERYLPDAASNTLLKQGTFTATLHATAAPPGYPSASDHFAGELKDAAGAVDGALTIGWVSEYLRRATLEIATVSASEAPFDNGEGRNWPNLFDEVGWQVTVRRSDDDIAEPTDGSWSPAELHAAMLARRDNVDLDREWHYYLLAVRQLDSGDPGMMFDSRDADANHQPREGAAVASHYLFPNQPRYGRLQGCRSGAVKKTYFRTAAHELGHAFGLEHRPAESGFFMQTTDSLAEDPLGRPAPFPDNIKFTYAATDLTRLRHLPDICVRPGGAPPPTIFDDTPPRLNARGNPE